MTTESVDWHSPAYWKGLRRPERVPVPRPAPLITSLETLGWDQWPNMAVLIQKLAVRQGWRHKTGFARGYAPGASLDEWTLRDTITVWMVGHGTRALVAWKRLPDGSNEWGPAGAMIGHYAVGHTAAKHYLRHRAWK